MSRRNEQAGCALILAMILAVAVVVAWQLVAR